MTDAPGWPAEAREAVRLDECPPGLFLFNGMLGFRSEYTTTLENPRRYQPDAYVVESGEYFWGGTADSAERSALMVVPVEPITPTEHAAALAAQAMAMREACAKWHDAQASIAGEDAPGWPDPTLEMLADPLFEAIWQTIKRWDVNVPGVYVGYMGATGNHVRAILDAPALAALLAAERAAGVREGMEKAAGIARDYECSHPHLPDAIARAITAAMKETQG